MAREFDNQGHLRKLAGEGDARAAFAMFALEDGRSDKSAEAWQWLCVAADEGHSQAQRIVGSIYEFFL